MISIRLGLMLFSAMLFIAPGRSQPPASPPDYQRDIKPILAKHCLSCHGAEKQRGGLRLDRKAEALAGGDSGIAITPGKAETSHLLKRITSSDPAERMPPKGPALTPTEVSALRAWINAGAHWPDDSGPAATDWWSFRPVVRPTVPARDVWVRNPVDAFILAKLRHVGLQPSSEADRRTLLRRLKLDLLGLPPTPEEVAAFLADTAPDAYEKRVEQYLASSHFGERWGRHWLDTVRFAESHGFEMNWERPNAWPYRDWVIRSFNADKPYDRFVMEQLAGDQLGADEATGFLVGGPWDQVKSPDPGLTANQRADELHDMVGTTGSAFLGLTVGCARCHNHKFDPISQTDYYRIKAIFAGVHHGERAWSIGAPEARARDAATIREQLQTIDTELVKLEPIADPHSTTPRRSAVNARLNVERFAPVKALAVRFVIFESSTLEPCLDELEILTAGSDARNVALASAGAKLRSGGDYAKSPSIHRLEHLNDGKYGNSRSWIASDVGRGWCEVELKQATEIDRIIWGRDREGKYTDRLPIRYRIDVWTPNYQWITVASSADRAPAGGRNGSSAHGVSLNERLRWLVLTRLQSEMRLKLADAERLPMVYAGKFASPAPTVRFHRGDPLQPRERVEPGVLASIGPRSTLPADASDPQRRLALAQWIVHPEHPLTARVLVNRLWQWHFGTGLVDTPSDLGRNGGKPTHPELLDWLASELVNPTRLPNQPVPRSWSMKHIHRLIVTSATYRQASLANPRAQSADAQSRLLWRFPPRRLEAEAIRDSILFVSGQLDLTMGGPGFSLFRPNTNYVRVYQPKTSFGPAEYRRMVYMHKTRMQVDDTFGAFDCPDAGQVAPRRTSSTTPLQSLNLLNSPFLLQQAEAYAERIHREAGEDLNRQVSTAFQLAFQRDPSPVERAAAEVLIGKHGLASLCRALLNANEFLYLD